MTATEPLLAATTIQLCEEKAREIIDRQLITPHFQPIVDLRHGTTMAWEVLSRGPEPLSSPAAIFAAAERLGLSPRLESVCRAAALRAIAAFSPMIRTRPFFLNVSPSIVDPFLCHGQVHAELASIGLDQRNIIIEITERESISDYAGFEHRIHQYIERGFRIALSNIGAGHSGLVTWVTCSPHFMKLDIALSRDIHCHPYKQHLVKSLVAFAASLNLALIAEGVESWEELETLARLGVRHAQGFLFARPARLPCEITEDMRVELRRLVRQFSYSESDLNESVGPLVIRCASIHEGAMRGEDVDRMFHRDHSLDHLVVLRSDKPVGLITRQFYYTNTGGPVGYHLFQWQPAERLARQAPLIVEDSISVTALARLAMERPADELYDPVVVVDRSGRLIGTVTIRQLIMRSNALEVQSAQGASPLTGLPGNRSIERWILGVLDQADACVLYADLDRFKEFNDCYGFLQGDEMIRCLAHILSRWVADLPSEARLGHIGGDDFVVVTPAPIEPTHLQALCDRFDQSKLGLFNAQDVKRGCYRTTDRRGQEVSVSLVTLSVAVVPVEAVHAAGHPAALAQMAASLKRKVKEMTNATGKSMFLFERRVWGG